MKKWLIISLALLGVILATGCVNLGGNNTANTSDQYKSTNIPSGGATPSTMQQAIGDVSPITIQNNAFNPAQIQVNAGTTIQWTNNDATVHHIVGPGFDSGELAQGAKFTQNFATPGTYNYICLDTPSAKGMIIVK
jgi:plastocyanin